MIAPVAPPAIPKLSICIGTFNRARFIGETLDSVLDQMTPECEIVILDNASTDETAIVISDYAARYPSIRSVRQQTNQGLDRNFDAAVVHARGEFCLFMTDDDLLLPGAIARVLNELGDSLSVIVPDMEFRDFTMRRLVQRSAIKFDTDRRYRGDETDRFFVEVAQDRIMYIGGLVFRRELWMKRNRERFYGTWFIHVGTIFQEPLPGNVLVVATPLVSYRLGNTHTYSVQMLDIVFEKWPAVIELLSLSKSTREVVDRAQPWRHPKWLLVLRGWGYYSVAEYRRWIRSRPTSSWQKLMPFIVALTPAVLINTLLVIYYRVRGDRGRWVEAMKKSPHNLYARLGMARASSDC